MYCNSATHTAHANDVHLRFAKYVSHITAQEIWYTRAKHTWTGWGRVIEKHTSFHILTHKTENRRKNKKSHWTSPCQEGEGAMPHKI